MTGTGTEKIFSDEEKAGIVPRNLTSGSFNNENPWETDCIAGDTVEHALLWPLSTKEAEAMDSKLSEATAGWWLRSPGDDDVSTAVVGAAGLVSAKGTGVNLKFGLRPAFNFNLDSVILTSAAAGGKSSSEGKLSEVGTNDSGEWKLTVKDDAHENFKFESFFFFVDDKNLMGVTYHHLLLCS